MNLTCDELIRVYEEKHSNKDTIKKKKEEKPDSSVVDVSFADYSFLAHMFTIHLFDFRRKRAK